LIGQSRGQGVGNGSVQEGGRLARHHHVIEQGAGGPGGSGGIRIRRLEAWLTGRESGIGIGRREIRETRDCHDDIEARHLHAHVVPMVVHESHVLLCQYRVAASCHRTDLHVGGGSRRVLPVRGNRNLVGTGPHRPPKKFRASLLNQDIGADAAVHHVARAIVIGETGLETSGRGRKLIGITRDPARHDASGSTALRLGADGLGPTQRWVLAQIITRLIESFRGTSRRWGIVGENDRIVKHLTHNGTGGVHGFCDGSSYAHG